MTDPATFPYRLTQADRNQAVDTAAVLYPHATVGVHDDLAAARARGDRRMAAIYAQVIDHHTHWAAQERRAA